MLGEALLHFDADKIDKLNNVLRKGRKQLQIYATCDSLKLPKEVEAFIANKVNENISVNLNIAQASRKRGRNPGRRQISNAKVT